MQPLNDEYRGQISTGVGLGLNDLFFLPYPPDRLVLNVNKSCSYDWLPRVMQSYVQLCLVMFRMGVKTSKF